MIFLDVFVLKFFCSFTEHFFLRFLDFQILVIFLDCFLKKFIGDSIHRIGSTNLKGRTGSLP